MMGRLSNRAKTAAAVLLFAAALGIAGLRVGVLTHIGSLRLGAPYAMNDFYSATYYPVRAFLDGENPHDRERLNALYPKVEEYPPYLPFNLVLHLPFGLLPARPAAVAYFLFSAMLTLPLSIAALRLAGIVPSAWQVALVAALLLFSRPGHWALISGQHAIFLTLLAYLALLYARTSPALSGLALGLCMYKLTYGVPIALLMLAAGYARSVAIGGLVAGTLNLPPFLLLTLRAGGVEQFMRKLLAGFHDWESLPGMDPGSSLSAVTYNRTDVATLVSRFVGYSVSPAISLVLAAAVLAAAGFALYRLRRHDGKMAADLSLGLICLGTLIAVYHMTYDLVLLIAPVAALVACGLPRPAPAGGQIGFLILFAIPGLNWLLTDSVLHAWQPPHAVWLAVASTNTLCLVALFIGYLALALAYSRRDAVVVHTPSSLPGRLTST
jgi:Glycosyltransferase family 87